MYQNHYEEKSVSTDEEKVDKICVKLRQVLQILLILFLLRFTSPFIFIVTIF
jgi:hypothetical protein